MATKGADVTRNSDGTHTITFQGSSTLNNSLVVAFDDSKVLNHHELGEALEAAGRAMRKRASKGEAPNQFPTSGTETT